MNRKHILSQIIKERPDAVLVALKYKVLVGMIKRLYPNQFSKIDYKIWEDIAFDLINGDRDWRLLSAGKDQLNKKILEQQWILDNLK